MCIFTLNFLFRTMVDAKRLKIEEDEGMYRPNCQTNLAIVLNALPQ